MLLKSKDTEIMEDNTNWWEAISEKFPDECLKTVWTEIKTMEKMSAWYVIDRTDNMNDIDYIWEFDLKRFTDGLINKSRASFFARGDKQLEGVDSFKTYALVVK